MVTNRYNEHIADFANDYVKIKDLALKEKQLNTIQEWMGEKILKEVNVENWIGTPGNDLHGTLRLYIYVATSSSSRSTSCAAATMVSLVERPAPATISSSAASCTGAVSSPLASRWMLSTHSLMRFAAGS